MGHPYLWKGKSYFCRRLPICLWENPSFSGKCPASGGNIFELKPANLGWLNKTWNLSYGNPSVCWNRKPFVGVCVLISFFWVIAFTHDKQRSSICCLSKMAFHHAWLNYNRLLLCASVHQQGRNNVETNSPVLLSQLTIAPPWNSVLLLNSWRGYMTCFVFICSSSVI